MHWSTPLRKQWLIEYQSPLTELLGRDFFLTAPKGPGVYRFYGRHAGQSDALLYVGKAKNLRTRLASYRRASPESVSRKVLWMLRQTQRIELELCRSERAALLRENELLRTLRPPYNVLNTEPENYVFIALKRFDRGMRFRVTSEKPSRVPNEERFFGVFKSRASVREGYGSFLRLLWLSTHQRELPGALLRYKPPTPYLLVQELSPRWEKLIVDYFSGRSRGLLREMTTALLENSGISPLLYRRVQEDLGVLQEFFRSHCARNRRLCRHFGRAGSLIAQNEIDDWNVLQGCDSPIHLG